ncbi:hypothetical protein [Alysiella crassa]|nr:hypothetical protein [Alysiella crassa]UOP07504.1 hypothetical protein LVJ80_03605 [Alysiella crassa]
MWGAYYAPNCTQFEWFGAWYAPYCYLCCMLSGSLKNRHNLDTPPKLSTK